MCQCTALQDKVTNLEAALEQVEAVSAARCEDAVAQTEAYMRDRNAEMETLRNELVTAKAELALSTQLKKQVT